MKATRRAACSQCQRASAESIIKRPAVCRHGGSNCFVTALANFHTATMRQNWARLEGGPVKGIGGFLNYPIFMVTPHKGGGFISLDGVSALSGPAFSVTWERPGTIVPITLGPRR